MKNKIKLFEEFQDDENKEIDLDIQDIFIDLFDNNDGWKVSTPFPFKIKEDGEIKDCKYVIITKESRFAAPNGFKYFRLEEIEYQLHHLIMRMESLGFEYSVRAIGRYNSHYDLIIKPGDYIRKIQGIFEWRFDEKVKELKLTFVK
jgi:hypothetical protein